MAKIYVHFEQEPEWTWKVTVDTEDKTAAQIIEVFKRK